MDINSIIKTFIKYYAIINTGLLTVVAMLGLYQSVEVLMQGYPGLGTLFLFFYGGILTGGTLTINYFLTKYGKAE